MPKANEPQGPFPPQQENPSRTKDEALRKACEALKASKDGELLAVVHPSQLKNGYLQRDAEAAHGVTEKGGAA